jgi:hypothetical protein
MAVKGNARACFFLEEDFFASGAAFVTAGAFALGCAGAFAVASGVAFALAEEVFLAALTVWVIVDWMVKTRPGELLVVSVFPAGACLFLEKKIQ